MLKRFLSAILSTIIVAATFYVPVHAAGIVGNGTPASCTEATLVAALVGGGAITFNCGPNPHTITFTSRKTISANTSIDGAGKISFNGGGSTGFFDLPATRILTLTAMTLTNAGNASSPSSGLGIQVGSGKLFVSNSTFSQNTRGAIAGFNADSLVTIANSQFISNSSTGFGGAIYNTGQLLINDSVFSGNAASASYEGGAIYNVGSSAAPGKVTIVRTSFISNTGGYGGAISNYGELTMTQSTLTQNGTTFNGGGGGIILNGSGGLLRLVNVTMTGNTSMPNNNGAAIYVNGSTNRVGRVTLVNVTLADNGSANGQIYIANLGEVDAKNTIFANGQCKKDPTATLTDSGGNLAFNSANCPGTSADPLLGVLQDNGGPTFTRALASNSPARDQGTNAGCPAYDQRGVIRPQQNTCDIGALEYTALPIFDSINPIQVCLGSNNQIFTITGSNFVDGPSGTRVKLNGAPAPTTFVGPTQLTAAVGATELAAPPHTLTFTLETPVVDGGVSVATRTVIVDVCSQPIAGLSATSNSPTLLGKTTQLTATITSGDGVSYEWDFGDGQTGSGPNPIHTYTSIGSYIAVVTATNKLGRAVADTVVNVNLATTAKIIGELTSEFGTLITYTYRVTNVTAAGPGTDVSVIISGNIPSNTALVRVTNATTITTGGDYGNGFVLTQPAVVIQAGQSYSITWTVQPLVVLGDIINQAHASTDDGRLQMFERDRVFRIFMMLLFK